jgi:hypothetical protein
MEQISRLELDRLVELYDLAHNADFSDASDKSTDKAYSKYIREVTRLHEAKFSNLSIGNLKKLVALECKKVIAAQFKPPRKKRK